MKTVLLTGSCLAIAAGALLAPAANAATDPCSPVVGYGKQICMDVGKTAVTATLKVNAGGRGWFGQVEIDGPAGELVRTGDHTLGAPASWPVTHPAAGSGKYCAIDWRWDVYHDDYFQENQVCVTAG